MAEHLRIFAFVIGRTERNALHMVYQSRSLMTQQAQLNSLIHAGRLEMAGKTYGPNAIILAVAAAVGILARIKIAIELKGEVLLSKSIVLAGHVLGEGEGGSGEHAGDKGGSEIDMHC